MAALRGAHLSTMGQKTGQQPTIFDVMSQESLMTALKPAVRHLVKYLAHVHPERFENASKWYDELYMVFDLVLENHYLKRYGGSFSENFYGMKRLLQTTGKSPISGLSRLQSLFILVVWPYLRDKLDKLHDELKLRLAYVSNTNSTLRIRLAKLFVSLYPWLKSIISAVTFALQLAYMINRSSIHSPWLWMAGVRLEKLTPEDIAAFDAIPAHLQPTGIVNRLWRVLLSLPGVFSRLFGYGLFFVQFIDFMYNSDLGAQMKKQNSSWNIPKAPHKFLLSEENVQLLETNKCPLCMKRRENDTALSVSGYVFCYTCIDAHIRNYAACPVTGLPATAQQLIRLYHA